MIPPKLRSRKYRKTFKGLSITIYGKQKYSSKIRDHNSPEYSLKEFRDWLLNQSNFQLLFYNWKNSNFKKDLIPSVNRLNDYLPYTLNNIELITWKEHYKLSGQNVLLRKNTKLCRQVHRYTLDNIYIDTFFSQRNAGIKTCIQESHISQVCSGKRNHAGGYIWRNHLI